MFFDLLPEIQMFLELSSFLDKKSAKNMNFSTQTDGKYHDFFNIHTANTHMCVGHLT